MLIDLQKPLQLDFLSFELQNALLQQRMSCDKNVFPNIKPYASLNRV